MFGVQGKFIKASTGNTYIYIRAMCINTSGQMFAFSIFYGTRPIRTSKRIYTFLPSVHCIALLLRMYMFVCYCFVLLLLLLSLLQIATSFSLEEDRARWNTIKSFWEKKKFVNTWCSSILVCRTRAILFFLLVIKRKLCCICELYTVREFVWREIFVAVSYGNFRIGNIRNWCFFFFLAFYDWNERSAYIDC